MELEEIKQHFNRILRIVYDEIVTVETDTNQPNYDWILRWITEPVIPQPDVEQLVNRLLLEEGWEWEEFEEEVAPTYRQKRMLAYHQTLSQEGTELPSIGDQLDAIYKALYGDFSELDALWADIQRIKSLHPIESRGRGRGRP